MCHCPRLCSRLWNITFQTIAKHNSQGLGGAESELRGAHANHALLVSMPTTALLVPEAALLLAGPPGSQQCPKTLTITVPLKEKNNVCSECES